MRAYLIDPFTATLSEIDCDPDNTDIGPLIDASFITSCRVDKNHMLLLDDMGLHTRKPRFILTTYPHPLVGKALLIGVAPGGATIEPKLTLDQARRFFIFKRNRVAKPA